MLVWYVIIIHLVLAIVLFYLVNWIGTRSKPLGFGYVQISVGIQDDTAPLFNYFFKVLSPVIYIVLLMALFQAAGLSVFNEKIYWIVIDYWAFRFLFITIRGRLSLLNWPIQILYWVSSIGLAYWLYSVIDKVGTILPDPKTLLEELWILIIIFLYSIFNKLDYSRAGAERRIKNYTAKKYQQFKESFGTIIDSSFELDEFKVLVYAVMVFEDFNRPKLARFVERSLFCRSHKAHTYGVMQVMSNHPLSDKESVKQGILKLKDIARSGLDSYYYNDEVGYNIRYICSHAAEGYNPGNKDYADQVMQVYDNLAEMFYPSLRDYINKDVVPQDLE